MKQTWRREISLRLGRTLPRRIESGPSFMGLTHGRRQRRLLTSMTVLHQQAGQHDEAEADFKEALKNIAASHPDGSPHEARALERYAAFLEDTGRVMEAQQARDQAAHLWSQIGSCKG